MKKIAFLVSAFFLVIVFSGRPGLSQETDPSITGISRAFNPAISLNGLFYGMGTSLESEEHHEDESEGHHHGLEPGIHLQEVELAITANVDPYLRADATFASHGENVELESLFITTLQAPAGFQVRLGKFYVPFGLHNQLHTHAFPFVEPPLINQGTFGHHGWIDTGVTCSWLAPLPWYFNLTVGGFGGPEEGVFSSSPEEEFVGFGRIENLFDLSDAATFRVGGSFAWGPAILESDTSTVPDARVVEQVWGADLQFKWRPPQFQQTRGLVLQAEWLERQRLFNDNEWIGAGKGYYVMGLAQVSRWWWLQARYDWRERQPTPKGDPIFYQHEDEDMNLGLQRWSYAVALVPTHFQAYKLEYSVIDHGGRLEYRTCFQVNFTIGSHPAHEY